MIGLVIILGLGASTAVALPNPTDFIEGTCDDSKITPVVANRATMDSFKYIQAGSKLVMYSIAAGMMRDYANLREDEFYYEACYNRNSTTLRDSVGTIFGFNGESMSFNITGNPPGTYLDIAPLDPELLENFGRIKETITLTDNKTFLFSFVCFGKTNLRGWDIISLTPRLPEETLKLIEDHAAALGFKRENFVFLRYNSCKNPFIPGAHYL